MADRDSLTAARLREVLHYDPLLGWFMWKIWTSTRTPAGAAAGSIHKRNGYIRIVVDGIQYSAHRLAFLYMTGAWPKLDEVDHRDTVRSNNDWENLRDVPLQLNRQNMRRPQCRNKTGFLGVHQSKVNGKFKSGIGNGTRGRKNHLGTFASAEEAHAAYLAAKRAFHDGCTL